MEFLRPALLRFEPYDAVLPQTADKLDANEFPRDLPEWFKKKLSLVWEKGIASHRYPDATHGSLKQAIAKYAGVAADQISMGNGSDELIRSLLLVSCLEGRGGVLVPEPTFSMYAVTAETLGIPVVRVPRDPVSLGLDLSACQQALQENRIRVVCLVSPNSPTGNGVTEAEWQWARSLPADVLVIVDEAYYEFSRQTVAAEVIDRPNWVVLRTFSKGFRLAAHRVGYAIAHPQVARVLEAIRLPYNLPMFSQWAVQLALDFAEDLLVEVPAILQERDRLFEALAQIPEVQIWPSQANFLYLRVKGWDLKRLQQEWLNQGTCARYTGGGLRLTVGTSEENQRSLWNLQQALHLTQQPLPLA